MGQAPNAEGHAPHADQVELLEVVLAGGDGYRPVKAGVSYLKDGGRSAGGEVKLVSFSGGEQENAKAEENKYVTLDLLDRQKFTVGLSQSVECDEGLSPCKELEDIPSQEAKILKIPRAQKEAYVQKLEKTEVKGFE